MQPLYPSLAKLRGSAQLIPRSKFLSDGIAILNLRLDVFHFDTGDLGKILEPFANAFFPEGATARSSTRYFPKIPSLKQRSDDEAKAEEDDTNPHSDTKIFSTTHLTTYQGSILSQLSDFFATTKKTEHCMGFR
jgi:hypothetical protein